VIHLLLFGLGRLGAVQEDRKWIRQSRNHGEQDRVEKINLY